MAIICVISSQALDEQYLGVDAQFGGVDQRKIFTFAEKVCFSFDVLYSLLVIILLYFSIFPHWAMQNESI